MAETHSSVNALARPNKAAKGASVLSRASRYLQRIRTQSKFAAARKRADEKAGYSRKIAGIGRGLIHDALGRVATERSFIPHTLFATMDGHDLRIFLGEFRKWESEPDGLAPYPIDILAARMFRAGQMSHKLAKGCTTDADAFTLLRADELAGAGPEAAYPVAAELAASPRSCGSCVTTKTGRTRTASRRMSLSCR